MSGRMSSRDGVGTGLMLAAAALMTVGVVMQASTGLQPGRSLYEAASWRAPVVRQAAFTAVGVVVMLACGWVGPCVFRWRRGSWVQPSVFFLGIVVVLLASVWIHDFGVESHGRRRWVAIGPVGFQPSELAKLGLVVFLSAVLTRSGRKDASGRPDLTAAMLAIGLVCAMVGREDFGTAVLLAVVGGLMVLVRGCPMSTLAAWTVPAVGAFWYLLVSHPYRVKRLMAFRHIWDDPQGAGYHPIQSLAAIASGGWTGRGLGAGLAKYGYLPEGRTDFVFSIICEELGAFGGAMVIMLFITLVLLGLATMRRAPTSDGGFARLFAFGVTVTVGLQALINMAVVTVLAPTKGIALPLVSAGGTGVLCFCAAIGLLSGVPRLRSIGRLADVWGVAGSVRAVGPGGSEDTARVIGSGCSGAAPAVLPAGETV